MAADAEETGFLSRWARRKAQVRQGAVPDEPAAPTRPPAAPAVEPQAASLVTEPPAAPLAKADPPPTMNDVAELTHESDYTRFVAQGVQPEVKNAALKRLFTDPHFNVMDGLDTYIDDYGKPDPLPEGMLRQMVQSKMLGLFAEDEDKEPAGPPTAAPPTPETAPDEDTDLRLQPDDDAGRTGPEPGAGEDAGRQH
jgi:Protein of unknown function (DUF3306)